MGNVEVFATGSEKKYDERIRDKMKFQSMLDPGTEIYSLSDAVGSQYHCAPSETVR